MPLGIVDAAHIFTTLTDPLMSHLQVERARSKIYIDDSISFCESFEQGLLQEFFLKGGWFFKPSRSSLSLLKGLNIWD